MKRSTVEVFMDADGERDVTVKCSRILQAERSMMGKGFMDIARQVQHETVNGSIFMDVADGQQDVSVNYPIGTASQAHATVKGLMNVARRTQDVITKIAKFVMAHPDSPL